MEYFLTQHIGKYGCHITSNPATTDGELVSPGGTQEGKNTCHPADIRQEPLPMVSPEEAQDVKTVYYAE